jgi:signal transduction histidine kinase
MQGFWESAIVPVYFVYGLAFYSLGLALLIESGRTSELSLGRAIRYLAGFGLLHGLHEWLDMIQRELALNYNTELPLWAHWFRLSCLVSSFFALMVFGQALMQLDRLVKPHRLVVALVLVYSALAIGGALVLELNDQAWIASADGLARYMIGIPGAVMACVALWRQRGIFRERNMNLFVTDITIAAIALGLYGVVGQIIVPPSDFALAQIINSERFLDTFGLPVQVIRAGLAVIVTVSMIRVLRALEVENQQRLSAMVEARHRTEVETSQQLARLNEELRLINQQKEKLLHEVRQRDALRGVLLKRITAAQEAERQRIARELHDETGQALTGLAMGLRGITTKLTKTGNESEARFLSTLEKTATSALGDLRGLINDLRPPQLDDMGLVAALRWLVNRCNQTHNSLSVEFTVEGEPFPLPPEIETTLFRITQEGLNNTIKHAMATRAGVKLNFGEIIELLIWDDGKGFDPDEMLEPHTTRTAWGLLGIQERAGLIDADLILKSARGEGTRLIVRLDLEKVLLE